jgi:4-amino-4-deoxy-L-arabinose transferase-like glycosyltransferase
MAPATRPFFHCIWRAQILSRFRRLWLPLALTLLALAVRLHNLTYHSLWFDEAMSVHWARSSLPHILEVSMNLVEDRLPPLYYLSLHYWRLLVADGEVAVRLPSVLLGTLLIPVVYRLASDLFDRRVGSLAAALAVLNPFLVWYSQEARMYAMAVLLATLGTWFFLRATTFALSQKRNKGVVSYASIPYWLAYGLCALAGLYTHLYIGFLLPAHAIYLLLTRHWSRRAWLPFVLTMLAIALLFAPLGLAAWRASSEAGPGDPLTGFWARAWWLLSAFTIWKAPLPPFLSVAITAVVAGLVVVGLLSQRPTSPQASQDGQPEDTRLPAGPPWAAPEAGLWGKARSRPYLKSIGSSPQSPATSPQLLIGLLLLTPPAIATLLLFRNQVAFFGERYFIVILPCLLIAAATGAIHLADRLPPLLGLKLETRNQSPIIRHLLPTAYSLLPALCYLLPLTFTLIPLPGQWSPPARKEAWRETVGYLATHACPEDAILIHPDWTRYPLQYYFRGPGQTYAVFGSVDDNTDLEGPLIVISGAHPVIWLVESHTELADPDHRVNAWLAARYPEVTELYPPGLVAVRAYAPGYLSDRLPDCATPVSVVFEGGLSLIGYSVPQTQVHAADDLFHPPSGWVHVTLYWTGGAPLPRGHTPFVHLVDDLGQVWGTSLERPNDAFDFYPPPRWQSGQVVRADFDVNLNPITPPGRYTLVVGLHDTSGVQVPLTDGSPQAPLASIEIVR